MAPVTSHRPLRIVERTDDSRRAGLWLAAFAVMVFVMILVGGATRLNPAAVQFNHRILAIVTFLARATLRRHRPPPRTARGNTRPRSAVQCNVASPLLPRPVTLPSIGVGFQTLRSNLLRTALSTLGVVMGVASLVAVLSLGDGMERFTRDQIEQTTSLQAVSIVPLSGRQVDGVFVPDTGAPQLTAADAALIDRVPGVQEIVLTVRGSALVRHADSVAARGAFVFGTHAGEAHAARMRIVHGRRLTSAELAGDHPLAVVSTAAAARIVPGAQAASLVGDSIVLQEQAFEVVGITAEEDPTIHVPFARALPAMVPAPGGRIPTLVAVADSAESVLRTRDAIEAALLQAHPDWKDRMRVETNERRVEQVTQGILVFKLFMGAITGISLLVGGIGIMNVLLAAVAERTREIGIRRATGARRSDILVQFLSESVAITSLGAAFGLALGLAGALGATAIMRRMSEAKVYASFSLSTLLVASIAAVFVGLVFGTYPALRASRLSPIDAIRHE